MKPVVEVKDLSFSYQGQNVLTDVSFTINQGEFVGIIGPNGGGKTTLLKLLMGFLKPASGSILLFGEAPKNALKKISYVPQALRFDKQFPISVLEVVLSGRLKNLPWYGKFSSEDVQLAADALKQMNLDQYKNASFGSLSGGQAQRALIARALVSRPKLLLLDEPTAGVDAQSTADIYAYLKSLKKQMTIVMVTHDLKALIDQVQRVLCVQNHLSDLEPKDVCGHFALGLYHPPMLEKVKKSP